MLLQFILIVCRAQDEKSCATFEDQSNSLLSALTNKAMANSIELSNSIEMKVSLDSKAMSQ